VPESKKGLFHSHSATVAAFLKASHIQINARNEVRLTTKWAHTLELTD
jgi:hypothetical protein